MATSGLNPLAPVHTLRSNESESRKLFEEFVHWAETFQWTERSSGTPKLAHKNVTIEMTGTLLVSSHTATSTLS